MEPACTRPERVEMNINVVFYSLSGKQKWRPCQEAGGYPGCCAFWGVDGSSGVRDQCQREHKCRGGKIYITLYRIPIRSYMTFLIHKLSELHVLVCVSSAVTSNWDYFYFWWCWLLLSCVKSKVNEKKSIEQNSNYRWDTNSLPSEKSFVPSTQPAHHTNTSLIEHFYTVFPKAWFFSKRF